MATDYNPLTNDRSADLDQARVEQLTAGTLAVEGDLHVGGDIQFHGEVLLDVPPSAVLISNSLSKLRASSLVTTTDMVLQVTDNQFQIDTPQPLSSTDSPVFQNLTLVGLPSLLPVKTNALNDLTASAISLASGEVSGILPISKGGTNSSASLVNGMLIQSTAGALVEGTSSTNPTFQTMNLSNSSNQLVLGTTTITAPLPTAPRQVTLPDTGVDSALVLSEGNSTINGVKTFGSAPVLSSLTNSLPLKLTALKVVTSGPISLSSGEVSSILPVAKGGTNSNTALNNNRIMHSWADSVLERPAMTNGQLIIGSTGTTPNNATLTGSGNILITNGAGSIAMDTVQPIQTTSQVQFNTLHLNAYTQQLRLGGSGGFNSTLVTCNIPTADRIITIEDPGVPYSIFILGHGNQTLSGVKTFTDRIRMQSGLRLDPTGLNTLVYDINASTPAGARTYTIPDAGVDASFLLTEGTQVIGAGKTFSSALLPTTSGTANIGSTTTKWGNLYLGMNAGLTYLGQGIRTANRAELFLHANGDQASDILFGVNARTDANTKWTLSSRAVGDNNDFVLYRAPMLAGTFESVLRVNGANSQVSFPLTTDASSTTTGAVTTAGGLSIGKNLYVGQAVYLPSVGGTPAGLNHYEEYTHVSTVAGPWSPSPTMTIYCTRIGRVVHAMTTTDVSGTYYGPFTATVNTALPARFRPAGYIRCFSLVLNGTPNAEVTWADVSTTGSIVWSFMFGGGSPATLLTFTWTWTV